jgi:hypothetical protein
VTPPRCAGDIFRDGQPVALLDARSAHAEAWVIDLAKRADSRVDWHYSGGVAQVLHLGDLASRRRVLEVIAAMPKSEDVRIMRVMDLEGGGGLYRAGVTEAPAGMVAAFTGIDGEQAFVVKTGGAR